MRKLPTFLALTASVSLLTACDKPPAWGEWNSIIVGTSDAQWASVSELVESAVEARVLTVRPEKTFRVTHQDPFEEREWGRLQRFRQVLLIGTADDSWMVDALALSKRDSFTPPEIFQVNDVWARGQVATVLLLQSEGAAGVEPLMEPLHDLLDGQYREWVRSRMFMSGRNDALADTLWDEARFRLVLPSLYRRSQVDSVYIFRNENPDPSELLRQVTVTWRTPIAEAIAQDYMLAWRHEVQEEHYSYPQVVDLSMSSTRRLQLGDLVLDELRAIWANPPEDMYPAGGPMITRIIPCPEQDRLYLVDAWLYAPAREKYQYMLQLETILNSFRCTAPVTSAALVPTSPIQSGPQ